MTRGDVLFRLEGVQTWSQAVYLKWGMWLGHPLKIFIFTVVLKVLVSVISKEKERNGIWILKEKTKLSLFIIDTAYIKNMTAYGGGKSFKVIREFCEHAGYETGIQKYQFW